MSAADGAAASFELLREDGGLRLRCVGAWTTRELARHDAALRRLDLQGARAVAVELGDCSAIDSAGAWVLERTLDDLKRRGVPVSLVDCPPAIQTLLGPVARTPVELPPAPNPYHPTGAGRVGLGPQDRKSREGGKRLAS